MTLLHLFPSRAIQILPNKLITVVGQHSTDYPVDNLCLSHGEQYLVSGSYDRVSFWPAEEIPKLKLTDEETDSSAAASDEGEERKRRKRRRKCRKIWKQTGKPRKLKQKSDFFADLWPEITLSQWIQVHAKSEIQKKIIQRAGTHTGSQCSSLKTHKICLACVKSSS